MVKEEEVVGEINIGWKRKLMLILLSIVTTVFFYNNYLCFSRKNIVMAMEDSTDIAELLEEVEEEPIPVVTSIPEEKTDTEIVTTILVPVTSMITITTTIVPTTVCTTTTTTIDHIEISYYMDLSQPTGLTEDQFCKAMESLPYDDNDLYGDADFFSTNASSIYKWAKAYHVNEVFLAGVMAGEDGWYNKSSINNFTGITDDYGDLVCYAVADDGIKAAARLLGEDYLSPKGCYYNGTSLWGVVYYYNRAYPEHWTNLVYSCMDLIAEHINSQLQL